MAKCYECDGDQFTCTCDSYCQQEDTDVTFFCTALSRMVRVVTIHNGDSWRAVVSYP